MRAAAAVVISSLEIPTGQGKYLRDSTWARACCPLDSLSDETTPAAQEEKQPGWVPTPAVGIFGN
jgi:hypothetical protein